MELHKKLFIILILTMMFLGSMALVGIGKYFFELTPDITKTPSFMVSGEGKVEHKPDTADINFSVVTQGKDPVTIQSQSDQKMVGVINFLKSQGIKDDDIKTTGYDLVPQYIYYQVGRQLPQIAGYELTQSVKVKIRNIKTTGDVIGGLTSRGINQIGDISFYLDNTDAVKAQARAQAIAKATVSANQIASSLGVRIDKILSFSESSNIPVPYTLSADKFAAGGMAAGVSVSPVQPGTGEITSDVTITYSFR